MEYPGDHSLMHTSVLQRATTGLEMGQLVDAEHVSGIDELVAAIFKHV